MFHSLKINVLIQGMNPSVFYGRAKTYKAQVALRPDDSEDEDGEINCDAEEVVVEPLQGESEDESEEEVEDGDEETLRVDSPQEGKHGDKGNIVDWFRIR